MCPCWKVNLFKELEPYKDSNRTSKLGFWVQKLFLVVHHLPHVQGFIWWYTSQPWLWRQSTAITTCQVEWQTNCRWWYVVVSFFCHSYLFLCQHQQPAQSSLACHIQLVGGSACLVEHRGDWKWLREAYGLKAHWSAGTYICHLCNAKSAKNPCRWSRILGLYFNKICVWTPQSLDMFFAIVCVCANPVNHLDSWVYFSWFGLNLRWTQLTDHFPRRSPQDALDNVFRLSYAKMIVHFGFEFDLQWCFWKWGVYL